MPRGRNQAVPDGAKQQAETDTLEVPPEHVEELHCESDWALEKLPGEVLESPSLQDIWKPSGHNPE